MTTETPRTDALFAEFEDVRDVNLLKTEVRKLERTLSEREGQLRECVEFIRGLECDCTVETRNLCGRCALLARLKETL